MSSIWRPVARVPFNKLHDARVQAHYALQWLARVATADKKDERTGVEWDASFGGLRTAALADGSNVGLRVADLTLVLMGAERSELPLDTRAEPEIAAWLSRTLAEKGVRAKLTAHLPYSIPHHPIELGARYSLKHLEESTQALALWLANGNAMLARVRTQLAKRKLKAPGVECGPQHFDCETVVPLRRGHTMRVGFSPGDEYCDEPHFYVTMHPEPPIPGLPLLPAIGHWHTHEFLAAFAPAHKIVAATDQGAFVENFLDVAIATALERLG